MYCKGTGKHEISRQDDGGAKNVEIEEPAVTRRYLARLHPVTFVQIEVVIAIILCFT
jgi:hypothetical protein